MQLSSTTIVLIRHAQTIWNREQRHSGNSEVALSPEADKQIALLTRHLLTLDPTALYSSPLSRCILTIQPLADILQLPLTITNDLQERHLGEWEGHAPTDLMPTHPGYRYPFSAYNGDFPIPGAEPLDDLFSRIQSTLNQIITQNPGQTCIVSTHSGVIWTILHRLVNNPPQEDTWPPNCSITTIQPRDTSWELIDFKTLF